MENLADYELWDRYPKYHKWFNKLYISELLNYKCGPSGTAPTVSDYYVVRPIYNLAGMGLGASVKWIDAGDKSAVPPGYFWCEYFKGFHYSATYKFRHGGINTSKPYWEPLHCWIGYNSSNNLTKFTKWERSSSYIPEVPREFNELSGFIINIEFKGQNPIEVHLRGSGNPDGSLDSNYNEYIPVWASDAIDIDSYIALGYTYLPDEEDMSDVYPYTTERRLGFLVK